ncbi:MAG TPA: CHASE2 domain-containing protein [Coleofasciculaceae cyanobacterium]
MISRLSSKLRSLLSKGDRLIAAIPEWAGSVIFTSAVVTALLVGVRQLGALEPSELWAYDQLMRRRPDEGPDPRLLVIGITEDDLLKEYPISDATIGKLFNTLQKHQPRGIGLDIFREIPRAQGRPALAKELKQPNITVVCKMSQENNPGVPPPPELAPEQVGVADLPGDRGGTQRRTLLITAPPQPTKPWSNQHLCNDPEQQLVSFAFQLAMFYLSTEGEGMEPEQTEDGQLKIGSTIFRRLDPDAGGYRNADVPDYQLLINYRSPKRVSEQVSLTEALSGELNPELVRDRIVLIGYVAPSIKDDYFTPYSAGLDDDQKMPGVMVHAQVVSQILSTTLDGRPLIGYWTQWGEVLWIWGWSLAGGVIAWYVRTPWKFGLAGGAAIAVLVGGSFGLLLLAQWVPLVPPALAVIGTAVGVALVDRFNKSEYGQAFYEGVKGVLRLNIEIDQTQKEEQVAEITETEYFKTLHQKAKELRNQRSSTGIEGIVESNGEVQDAEQIESDVASEAPEEDYFQNLQRQRQQFKRPDAQPQKISQDVAPAAPEEDYFQNLQRQGRQFKRPDAQLDEISQDVAPAAPEEDFPSWQSQEEHLTLSDPQASESNQAAAPPAEEDDYFKNLGQKGKRLRKHDH